MTGVEIRVIRVLTNGIQVVKSRMPADLNWRISPVRKTRLRESNGDCVS